MTTQNQTPENRTIENKTAEKVLLKYPEIGTTLRCVVLKSSFSQAILKILEVENVKTPVDYRVILKGNSVGEEIYVCDKIKVGEEIDCIVTSYGENGIYVSTL